MAGLKALIAAIGLAAFGAAAQAQQTEVMVIGNGTTLDSSYLSFSVRRAFDGDLKNGAKLRFDVSRAAFGFDLGGVQTNGQIVNTRLLVGTAWQNGGTNIAGYFGMSYETRTFSPVSAVVPNTYTVGVFVSGEASHDFPNDSTLIGLVEFETQQSKFYTSLHYLYPLHPRFKAGPTVNYLTERGYERWAGGLRGAVMVTSNIEVTGVWLYNQGGTPGGAKQDGHLFELQIRGLF